MQPIATITMDRHLEGAMTYTLQIMPVPTTTVILIVTVTMTVTVTITSGSEATISVPMMRKCIMKHFPHK